jgi:hypothetical protein
LGKTAAEIVTMLKEAFKDETMGKHKGMSGLIVSKEVKCLLKTNHVLAALPRAEVTKMLGKFAMLSLKIVVGTLTKFLK